MTLQEAIVARHSVRKYIDKEIPADIITALQDKIAECNKVGNFAVVWFIQRSQELSCHGW